MIEQSESIVKLSAAMVAASAELKNPPKDSVNPHFKSRFADLATVIDTVKPTLVKHKLAVIQLPTEHNGQPALATTLVHESGEWMRSVTLLCAAKSDPQGIGSAITYQRRYSLQAALNITADDDDDGNHGSAPRPQQQNRSNPLNSPPKPQPNNAATPNAGAKLADDLKATMQQKNWGWAAVVAEINSHEGTNHTKDTKLGEINADHLHDFLEWLKTQPAKPKTPNQGA